MIFCHDTCSCSLNTSNFGGNSYFSELFSINYGVNTMNVQECQNYAQSPRQAQFASLMITLERDYNCSGFCNYNQIFVYTGKSIQILFDNQTIPTDPG